MPSPGLLLAACRIDRAAYVPALRGVPAVCPIDWLALKDRLVAVLTVHPRVSPRRQEQSGWLPVP
jgi:hypothetical protein